MKSDLATTMVGALFSRFGHGQRVTAQAGTKRALQREAQNRKARAALYADTPTCPPSRQVNRHAGRMAAKAEVSRQLIIARRARIKAKRELAKAKAPLAKAA